MASDASQSIAGLAAEAVAPIVLTALQSIGATLDSLSLTAQNKIQAELRFGFSDFLTSSYNRCRQVKTIVSGDEPIPLTEAYVNLNLRCGDTILEDIDLIDRLETYRRVIISGLGGTGKSMFMKYLTISRFENTKGKIPLFVELRNLNNSDEKNLLKYIHYSCSSAKSAVSFESFDSVLISGGFILILDGLDEVDPQMRDRIAREIVEISQRFPKTILVVSSRHDTRFVGWQTFYTFHVENLNLKQSREIIKKSRYNKDRKAAFLREISSLWKTHDSFLSNPLLAIIMLVTFGKFADIPLKITLFYRLAFQTLFREHDAYKQFKRPILSDLELDDFERCFAAFCALSYTEGYISFTDSDANRFAKDAMRYARLGAKSDDYVTDLIDNVCMLQRDGTDLHFTHRSFQEYFTAAFTVSYREKNLLELFNLIAAREADNTLLYIKEMDINKLEVDWLVPLLGVYIDELYGVINNNTNVSVVRWLLTGMEVGSEGGVFSLSLRDKRIYSTLSSVGKLYPNFRSGASIAGIVGKMGSANIQNLVGDTSARELGKFRFLFEPKKIELEKDETEKKIVAEKTFVNFEASDEVWLKKLSIRDHALDLLQSLESLRDEISARRRAQESLLKLDP